MIEYKEAFTCQQCRQMCFTAEGAARHCAAALPAQLSIAELQGIVAVRWGTSAYSDAHNAREAPLNHADHALKHVVKSLGKVAAVLEAFDHRDPLAELAGLMTAGRTVRPTVDEVRDFLAAMLADIDIVTARLASVSPVGPIDKERAVVDRVAAKFPAAPSDAELADLTADREHEAAQAR
jgi:hypothetical protein